MRAIHLYRIPVLVVILVLLAGVSFGKAVDEKITFDDHIKPIFQQRCGSCHSGDKKSGGLDLTNFTNMMQGGGSGQPVEPGDAGSSYLYQLITHQESPEMPPGGTKIPDAEIAKIESWISLGALENSGSVAKNKTMNIEAVAISAGARPERIALPPRMSLEPFYHSTQNGVVNSIAISPWAPVAALAATKQILLYDLPSMNLIGTFAFPEGQANVLQFSRNGQLLLAGGGRHGLAGKVVVWDIATTERVIEVGEEVDNVMAADINADHSLVALGGPQKMLRVYSTGSGELKYEIKKHTDWITAIEFSPDGVLLATADRNGGLQVWESDTGNEYLPLAGHAKAVTDISWRADGLVLATAGEDATIRLWEMENGGQIRTWNGHANSVTGIKFTRDGQLVSSGREPLAKLWNQDGSLVRQLEGINEFGVSVAYCNESGSVVATDFSGQVCVWKSDGDPLKPGLLNANPPTLQTRLNLASTELAGANAIMNPFQQQLAAAESQLAAINETLNADQTSQQQLSQQLADARSQIEAIGQQMASGASARQAWSKELAETQQAAPLVAEALAGLNSASGLLPQDQELKNSAQQLSARHSILTARVTELETLINDSNKSDGSQLAKIAELEGQISATESMVAVAGTKVEQLQLEILPVQKLKDDLSSQFQTAKIDVDRLQSQVDRWQAEIAFHQALSLKLQELADARKLVEEKDVILESAAANMVQAQAELNQRTVEKQELESRAAAVQAELLKLRTPK